MILKQISRVEYDIFNLTQKEISKTTEQRVMAFQNFDCQVHDPS